MFLVSVIIPVFNVAKFVEEAVQSALDQPEVGEIIIVEDGSKDNSLEVCQKLNARFDKVRLLVHPNGENLGVSHSRNLGIKNAQFDFIAFLDADDWYLPNRFQKDKIVFENPEVMATYSLSSIFFSSKKQIMYGIEYDIEKTVSAAELNLFYCHLLKIDGAIGHTNANTIRKQVFEKVGGFDTRLKLHEDTELWNRIARNFLFHAAELERPVSVARRHNHNSISYRSKESQLLFLWVWIDNIGIKNLYTCEKNYFIYLYSRALSNPIKPDFLRKVVFHLTLRFLVFFRSPFIGYFYSSFRLPDVR